MHKIIMAIAVAALVILASAPAIGRGGHGHSCGGCSYGSPDLSWQALLPPANEPLNNGKGCWRWLPSPWGMIKLNVCAP